MLGEETPVELRLLEIPDAVKAAEGTAMELDDCAFPLLRKLEITDDAKLAFDGCNVGLLVGARPRGPGMERSDLLEANGGIFKPQGEAINAGAADDVKILVVGNPANTNCLIAMSNAPDVPRERFNAMTRLDHNRAIAQLANKLVAPGRRDHQHDHLGQPLDRPSTPTSSTPGSGTSRPGTRSTTRPGSPTSSSPRWPSAARRSSRPAAPPRAASAANAAIDHVHDWVLGTPKGDWVSMSVPADGSYGVDEGIISSFPCTCSAGEYSIVPSSRSPTSRASASTPRSPSSRKSATRSPSSGSSEGGPLPC